MRQAYLKFLNNIRLVAAWMAFMGYAGLIYGLSSISIKTEIPSFPFFDKFVHAAEFGLFSALLYLALRLTFQSRIFILILITTLISIFYGTLDEIHQSFVPSRDADPLDWVADTVGILVTQSIIYFAAKSKAVNPAKRK